MGTLRRDSDGSHPRAFTHLSYNTMCRVRPESGMRDNDGWRGSAEPSDYLLSVAMGHVDVAARKAADASGRKGENHAE